MTQIDHVNTYTYVFIFDNCYSCVPDKGTDLYGTADTIGCETIYSFNYKLPIGCAAQCHKMTGETGELFAGFSYEKDGPNENINIIGECHLCLLCPNNPGRRLYLPSQINSAFEVDRSKDLMKGKVP